MSMQIKMGVRNYRLTLLAQSILKFLGYDVSSLDGDFGSETDAAIREFQSDHELTVDGIVGKKTWEILLNKVQPLLEKDDYAEDMMLGILSARWESNDDPGAVGADKNGGASYGMYQISTRQGTMKQFLWFLQERNPDIFDILINAGGTLGASEATHEFVDKWKMLANTKKEIFSRLQNNFIEITHYYPLYSKLDGALLESCNASYVLKNVIWSIAVQHGSNGGFGIIKKALMGCDINATDKEEMISRIYDERSKVDIYFKNSTDDVKKSVKKRFTEERNAALALLKKEKNGAFKNCTASNEDVNGSVAA
jgi:peptidoglycan hydrolase-like protein with peptidoglycan-binding domain